MEADRRVLSPFRFLVVLLSFIMGGQWALAQVQLTIVAKGGDAAPGLNDSFGIFSQALINNSGQVTFFGAPSLNARFAGPMGVYLWNGGNLGVVAKTGDQVPGAPAGATLLSAWPGGFSDTGQVVIGGYLQGPGISPLDLYGFWVGAANQPLKHVAIENEQAEGFGPQTTYFWINTPRIAGGKIMFDAALSNPPPGGNFGSLWGGSVDHFGVIGRQAPGPDGTNYYGSVPAFVNAAGQVTFIAPPEGQSIINASGLWYGTFNSQQMVLQTGQEAPQIPGRTINGLFPARLNSAGSLSFMANLQEPIPDVDGDLVVDDRVIYTGTPGNLQVRARSGQPAPGLSGLIFGGESDFGHGAGSFEGVQQNSAGDIAFSAIVSGDGVSIYNNDAIYLGRAGAPLKLLAREGDAAPGAPAGAKFIADNSDLDQTNYAFSEPSINSRGQIIFSGMYAVDAGPMTTGIWATDVDDVLHLILYEGQQIDVGGGVMKIIGYLGRPYDLGLGTASEDGQNFVFNDAGQFVFTANFTDGTSAVVVAQVPEASLGILLLLAMGLARRRRLV